MLMDSENLADSENFNGIRKSLNCLIDQHFPPSSPLSKFSEFSEFSLFGSFSFIKNVLIFMNFPPSSKFSLFYDSITIF